MLRGTGVPGGECRPWVCSAMHAIPTPSLTRLFILSLSFLTGRARADRCSPGAAWEEWTHKNHPCVSPSAQWKLLLLMPLYD